MRSRFHSGLSRGALAVLAGLCFLGCSRREPGSRASSPEGALPGVDGASPVWLEEVARASGIDFVHENGARGDYQLPEIMGSGCAWLDHDGDGDLDLYLVQAGSGPARARNRLYRNDGGRFTDVSAAARVDHAGRGMGCAAGDYDNDGDIDLYVTNFGPNVLYQNDGSGVFTDVTAAAGVEERRWSASAAFVDADGDGRLDLFVANYMRHPERAATPCFDAAGRIEYCGPHSHFPPERNTLYKNLGDGTFRDVTGEAGMGATLGYGLGVVCADLNGDGNVDIYVAADDTANQLWVGDGKGRFVDRAVEWGAAFNTHGQAEAGMGVQAEDLDGDGNPDILVTNLVNETNTLYRGLGRGFFTDVTGLAGLSGPSLPHTGFGMGFFDADLDGDLDLAVANGRVRRGPRLAEAALPSPWDLYAEPDQLFEQVPGPAPPGYRFEERRGAGGAPFREPHLGRGLALGDYDNDGDIDVAVTSCGGRARLFRNIAPRRGHWLLVRAVREGGKTDAHNARVTVTAGGRRWTREVQPAYSYLSSNDPRLHFGLGEAERADVLVRWPDGSTSELAALAVDRVVTVEKGRGERVE